MVGGNNLAPWCHAWRLRQAVWLVMHGCFFAEWPPDGAIDHWTHLLCIFLQLLHHFPYFWNADISLQYLEIYMGRFMAMASTRKEMAEAVTEHVNSVYQCSQEIRPIKGTVQWDGTWVESSFNCRYVDTNNSVTVKVLNQILEGNPKPNSLP